jgi:uncharacterized Zn finger protein
MQQQNVNLNVSLDQTTSIACDECGSEAFVQVLFLRKVSRFVIGAQQDGLVPVPAFACNKCGHVNEEFQPKNLEEK